MPNYNYRCNSCGRTFEVTQKINDAKLLHCVKCNKFGLERLISQTTFKLVGKGWTGKLN